jgi:hypothetical protein
LQVRIPNPTKATAMTVLRAPFSFLPTNAYARQNRSADDLTAVSLFIASDQRCCSFRQFEISMPR